jgi:hypothetical protein
VRSRRGVLECGSEPEEKQTRRSKEKGKKKKKKQQGAARSLTLDLFLPPKTKTPQAKEFSKTTYRKTTYRLREVADKFEAWSRRQK